MSYSTKIQPLYHGLGGAHDLGPAYVSEVISCQSLPQSFCSRHMDIFNFIVTQGLPLEPSFPKWFFPRLVYDLHPQFMKVALLQMSSLNILPEISTQSNHSPYTFNTALFFLYHLCMSLLCVCVCMCVCVCVRDRSRDRDRDLIFCFSHQNINMGGQRLKYFYHVDMDYYVNAHKKTNRYCFVILFLQRRKFRHKKD